MNKVSARDIPAVDKILSSPALRCLTERLGQEQTVHLIRKAVNELRASVLEGAIEEDPFDPFQWVVDRVVSLESHRSSSRLQKVINATGVILHTNLGRAPLAKSAIEAMTAASGYSNVEIDLHSGKRSQRGADAIKLLKQLTGAEDAVIVNNCAAATVLVLQALAGGKEVVISRGQLIEIGGGFRLPEVFSTAGVFLKEVGTTNKTYLRDYEQATHELTGAILRVHRSNFHLSGFVAEPTIEELSNHPAFEAFPVIDDLGSGLVTDLSAHGIQEPTVQQSVQSGADVSLFSGDKLFGGPQCGIIVGKPKWLKLIKKHPMMRALRCDKTTLAGVAATAEIHLAGRAFTELPIFQTLSISSEKMLKRCEQWVASLPETIRSRTEILRTNSRIGGGSLPHVELSSWAIAVNADSTDQVAHKLRSGKPSVVGRQADDQLLLDLRTVAEEDLQVLADCLVQALS